MTTHYCPEAGPLHVVAWDNDGKPQHEEFEAYIPAIALFHTLEERYVNGVYTRKPSGLRNIRYIPALGSVFFGQIVTNKKEED